MPLTVALLGLRLGRLLALVPAGPGGLGEQPAPHPLDLVPDGAGAGGGRGPGRRLGDLGLHPLLLLPGELTLHGTLAAGLQAGAGQKVEVRFDKFLKKKNI